MDPWVHREAMAWRVAEVVGNHYHSNTDRGGGTHFRLPDTWPFFFGEVESVVFRFESIGVSALAWDTSGSNVFAGLRRLRAEAKLGVLRGFVKVLIGARSLAHDADTRRHDPKTGSSRPARESGEEQENSRSSSRSRSRRLKQFPGLTAASGEAGADDSG